MCLKIEESSEKVSEPDQFIVTGSYTKLFCIAQLPGPIRVRPHAGKFILSRMTVPAQERFGESLLLVDEVTGSRIDSHRVF